MNELQSTNELITTRPIEIVSINYCRGCGCRLTSNDNFCGHCGTDCRELIVGPATANRIDDSSDSQTTEIATVDSTAVTIQSVIDNRMVVVALIACFGPLGLLALWFSRRFSNRAKIFTTASYLLLFIVAPLAVIWYWLSIRLQPLVDVLGQ